MSQLKFNIFPYKFNIFPVQAAIKEYLVFLFELKDFYNKKEVYLV